MRIGVVIAAVAAMLGACGDTRGEGGPRDHVPGGRLSGRVVTEAVTDWGFAAAVSEIALETSTGTGWHSVTVWCVVVDGRLYVATDDSRARKRWVTMLGRRSNARVRIEGEVYPVRARRVVEGARWDAVVAEYRRKYPEIGRYDFPEAGDTERGRVFELVSREAVTEDR